ncbi:hypothetical protein [Streptomyces guryensis]|uniref:Uncharacterized protein n=1 Tax=Streptomyces guryensis TaxID=2886947 RepID=A0A9Q3VY22_9ACTN|nr:hypothetical protein [Streptomyces guryensis]MCD9879842.1 hypothetical protein [Streptomyces guryensis]
MSNRALQCKYGVTWSAVNKALTSAWPQPRTTTASARPSKLDPFTLLIDETLLSALWQRKPLFDEQGLLRVWGMTATV